MELHTLERKYENLPLDCQGNIQCKLILEGIPEHFEVRCEPGRKYHVISKANSGRKSITLCANSLFVRSFLSSDKINLEYICQSCMEKLNTVMEECLYDEQKGEYYHPAPERI